MIAHVDWGYVDDWLGIVRWLHVFAAIMWVGATASFVVFDNFMRAPSEADAEAGILGQRHVLHGGNIYHVKRYATQSKGLPPDLHWWSPWYAYVTWLSGFGLLIVAYYWNPDTFLIDRSVAAIGAVAAVAISIGLLLGSLVVYEAVSRLFARREAVAAATLVVVLVGTTYGVSHLFSTRGMIIQIGAMMGTWMAANVVFVFVPSHRKLVAAKQAGTQADEAFAARSAQRGAHNTYLVLPVLFSMVSAHFSFVYASDHPVEALVVLMLVGALLRHFFVQRQQGHVIWSIPIAAAAAIVALAIWIEPRTASGAMTAVQPAAKAAVAGKHIFASAGCESCHTLRDARSSGTVGPNFDRAKPDRALVLERVTNGRGVMPPFKGRLSKQQIEDVATYVSTAAGR